MEGAGRVLVFGHFRCDHASCCASIVQKHGLSGLHPLFVLTVPVQQLVKVMRTIHIPVLLIELMVLIYRFIFIFIEEAAAIRHAQQLRFGYHGLKNSYKSLAMLVNVLFQRVMLRYRDMSVVLDVKLFQGDFHV